MFRSDLMWLVAASAVLRSCAPGAIEPAQESPTTRSVHYAGTVTQPAPGGTFTYRINGTWQLDGAGVLQRGIDSLQILDARVYGDSSVTTAVFRTSCLAIVGKEAWAEAVVTASSKPQQIAIGSMGVIHLDASTGVIRGGGGPKNFWYPKGNVCTDRPAGMRAFDMTDGAAFTL